MKSWVEVSGARLAANYGVLVEAAGVDTTVLAVVKANAYGHGAALCAPVLARAGAGWLGVTDAAEGVAVRAALAADGIAADKQPRVMVMCGLLEDEAEDVVQGGLVPVVWDRQQMEWLAEPVKPGTSLPVHLEIDTGMARQGVVPGAELEELLRWLVAEKRLRLDGVMTHFASSEVAGSRQTRDQQMRFEEAMRAVKAAGLRPAWVHAGNSSTIDSGGTDSGESERDASSRSSVEWLVDLAKGVGARAMVRAGLGLYGYCLPVESADGARVAGKACVRGGLLPVMTWKTRVIGLQEINAGDTVGYNATFVAAKPMRLALLPVGYADGLRRELSSTTAKAGGWVTVKGQRAAIVGRVSMNLTVVDVSGIADVAVGDEVVVLGDGMTADDHARLAHTIAYEIVCGMRASSRLV